MADVGPSGAEAIAMFVEVGILTPRYLYDEMNVYLSYLKSRLLMRYSSG